MKKGSRIFVVALWTAVAAACGTDDLGPKYTEISEEDSRIMFFGPGLAGGYRQFLVGTDENHLKRTTGDYGPYQGEYPNAYLRLVEKPPGRYFTRLRDVRELVRYWTRFREGKIVKGPSGTASNALGLIDYFAVTADGIACVLWRQPFGTASPRALGSMVLDGYYCKGEGPMMTAAEAESIVKLVGHRDYGKVWPPEDWWHVPGLLFAEILDYGPYRPPSSGGGSVTAGPEPAGRSPSLAAQSERIPGRPGTAFGVRYVVKGGKEGEAVDVTVRIQHPEIDGHTETSWTSSVRVGDPAFAGFRIGDRNLAATGVWTLEIMQEEWVLGGKAFRVVAPE